MHMWNLRDVSSMLSLVYKSYTQYKDEISKKMQNSNLSYLPYPTHEDNYTVLFLSV